MNSSSHLSFHAYFRYIYLFNRSMLQVLLTTSLTRHPYHYYLFTYERWDHYWHCIRKQVLQWGHHSHLASIWQWADCKWISNFTIDTLVIHHKKSPPNNSATCRVHCSLMLSFKKNKVANIRDYILANDDADIRWRNT